MTGIDDFLLHRPQYLYLLLYAALGDFEQRATVLSVAVVLVERTNPHSHALGYGVSRRIIAGAVYAHARRYLRQRLCECRLIPI